MKHTWLLESSSCVTLMSHGVTLLRITSSGKQGLLFPILLWLTLTNKPGLSNQTVSIISLTFQALLHRSGKINSTELRWGLVNMDWAAFKFDWGLANPLVLNMSRVWFCLDYYSGYEKYNWISFTSVQWHYRSKFCYNSRNLAHVGY